ncbi:CHAT domain-containing protein, partial [Mycena latifolia]
MTLGALLTERYHNLGDPQDLEKALQKSREVLGLTPQGHPGRPDSLEIVAQTLSIRYDRFGDFEDLEDALKMEQQAMDQSPEGDEKVKRLLNIGVLFFCRYRRLGDLDDLDAALRKQKEALDVTPKGHPDRPCFLGTIATSLIDRYRRLGDLKDIEDALQMQQEAIELTPDYHPDRASYLRQHAAYLIEKYQRLGDLTDLEDAVQSIRKGFHLIPEGHPEIRSHLRDLAWALKYRYERLGDLEDLESALENEQKVVDLTPERHSDRPQRLASLALSFADRYKRLRNPKDLELAFQRHQEAIDLTPESHPDRPGYLHNLALFLAYQFHCSGDVQYLESAVQRHREAVNLTVVGHAQRPHRLQDFATLLSARYAISKDKEDLEAALVCYRDSFKTPSSTPFISWKNALQWASCAQDFQPSDCPSAYMAAFRLLPDLFWIGHSIPVRHEAIHRLEIGQVTSTAAQSCISLDHLMPAIEIMEQGLAMTFQQLLQLKTDVDHLPPDQVNRFRALSSQLYAGTSAHSTRAAIERNQLLEDIRKQPGLEYFLLPQPYHVLQCAAQRGPVVILNSHEEHCDVLLILSSTTHPLHIPLPGVTLELVKSLQALLKELLSQCNVRMRGESQPTRLSGQRENFTSKTTHECFEDILDWLWQYIVEPYGIHDGRLWWLPTGAFAGLPLHACSPTDTDAFIHSYTATLGSLLEGYKKPSNGPHRFAVVGVTHTGRGTNFLKGVREEIKRITVVIKEPAVACLEGDKATVDAVKLQLQNCSWAHLACHGTQDLVNPPKSCLLLFGGRLELETILQMPLPNAEFVFLAACQTAMGDAILVNESFHLGGGFIAAGFRSAVGTLWSMNDADGPEVAESFYSYLFRDGRQPQASDAAEALHYAVKQLKKRNVPYERWIPFIHMG